MKIFKANPIFIISLLLSLFTGASFAKVDQIEVSYPGSKRKPAAIKAFEDKGIVYASLKDFAGAIDANTYYNPKTRKMVVYLYGKRVKVTADNPFVMVDDKIFNLPLGAKFKDDEIFVSLNRFIDLLRDYYPGKLVFSPKGYKLEIRTKEVNITGIRIEEKLNGTLIRISTTERFEEEEVSAPITQTNWLNVTIYGGKIDSTKLANEETGGIVRKILPFQLPESAQISFLLKGKVKEKIKEVSDRAITISLVTSTEVGPSRTATPKSLKDNLEKERAKWAIDCIVIDPGHGGKDPGAIGKSGYQEKTATLDIAKRLARLLRRRTDLRVILTRDDDTFIPLADRPKLANQKGGKLFISIHCNASLSRYAGGFETYFLSPARNDEAMEVAMRENSVIKYEEETHKYPDLTDENFILLAMAQASFVRESEDLAAIIQQKVDRRINLKNRGVDQAGFYVLMGASMPSVLVETAFISNPHEEKLLRTKKLRQKIAEGLYESIVEFKKKHEKM
ncbi:N-acetylmuramoyl-L-alanine amidase [candidate division KSB1 bacterium]|nr:N-acetylmuramoyl-L-alanine amidase [candidate division KSB1 bacterium]